MPQPPVPPKPQLNIEPIGPQAEREMRESLPPGQRKPGKTSDPKIKSTQESASQASEENPVQKPSSAPANPNDTKNTSASWVGYDNPWLSREG